MPINFNRFDNYIAFFNTIFDIKDINYPFIYIYFLTSDAFCDKTEYKC